MGGSDGDSRGSHSPAAQLLGGTQHGGQVAQVYLHGGDLRGGVLLQHQVPRGLRLLGVAAGEAQVDASILPQQPPAQSEPQAAATARWSASSAGGALPPSLPPHTPRPPSPRAHPLAPVTNTTRSIPVQTALPARPLPPPYIRYPPSPPAYVIAPPPSSANGRGRRGRGHAGGGVMVGRGAGRRVWAWPVRPRPPRALSPRPLGAPLFGAAPPRVAPGAARKARRHRASLQRVLPYIQVHLLNIYMPQQ